MTKHAILVATALVLAAGCALGPQKGDSLAGCAVVPAPLVRLPEVTVPSEPEQTAPADPVVLAAYDEPVLAEQDQEAEEVSSPRPVQVYGEGLTIETLEQLALANNPVVGQAAARVRALQDKSWQVGLKPNPTIGYVAGEMGNNSTVQPFHGRISSSAGHLAWPP